MPTHTHNTIISQKTCLYFDVRWCNCLGITAILKNKFGIFTQISCVFSSDSDSESQSSGISYFKEELFDGDTSVSLDTNLGIFGASNDDISSPQSAFLKIAIPSDATNDIIESSDNANCDELITHQYKKN